MFLPFVVSDIMVNTMYTVWSDPERLCSISTYPTYPALNLSLLPLVNRHSCPPIIGRDLILALHPRRDS